MESSFRRARTNFESKNNQPVLEDQITGFAHEHIMMTDAMVEDISDEEEKE
jgi:hypothetical protein